MDKNNGKEVDLKDLDKVAGGCNVELLEYFCKDCGQSVLIEADMKKPKCPLCGSSNVIRN